MPQFPQFKKNTSSKTWTDKYYDRYVLNVNEKLNKLGLTSEEANLDILTKSEFVNKIDTNRYEGSYQDLFANTESNLNILASKIAGKKQAEIDKANLPKPYEFDSADFPGYDKINEILDSILVEKPEFNPVANKWTGVVNEISKPYEEELKQKIDAERSFQNPYGGNTSLFAEKANKLWASEAARKAAQALGLAESEYGNKTNLFNEALGKKSALGSWRTGIAQLANEAERGDAWKSTTRGWDVSDAEKFRQQFVEDRNYNARLQSEAMKIYQDMQPNDWEYLLQGVGQAIPSVATNLLTGGASSLFGAGKKINPYDYYNPTSKLNVSGYGNWW